MKQVAIAGALPCPHSGVNSCSRTSEETGFRKEEWTMLDDTKHQERLQRKSHSAGLRRVFAE